MVCKRWKIRRYARLAAINSMCSPSTLTIVQAAHEQDRAFSMLSFNVFIGSPFPFVRLWVPCLVKSSRLTTQQQQLQRVNADVIAMQELHHDGVAMAYKTLNSSKYELYTGKYFNVMGRIVLFAMWLSIAAIVHFAGGSLRSWLATLIARCLESMPVSRDQLLQAIQAGNIGQVLEGLSLGLCFWFASWLVGSDTTAHAFCSGTVQSGLGVLYNRNKFRLVAAYTRNFSVQSGDVLNLLRPRAYQCLLLERLPSMTVEGESCPSTTGSAVESAQAEVAPSRIVIVHSHLNLGDDLCRSAQVGELLEAAECRELAACVRSEAGELWDPIAQPVPVIMCGDMNADPSTPSIQSIYTTGGFLDAYETCNPAPAATVSSAHGHTWSKENPLANSVMLEPDGRIDHIFYRSTCDAKSPGSPSAASPSSASSSSSSRSLQAIQTQIVFTEAPFHSDHFGYLTHFQLEARAGSPSPSSFCAGSGISAFSSSKGMAEAGGCGEGGRKTRVDSTDAGSVASSVDTEPASPSYLANSSSSSPCPDPTAISRQGSISLMDTTGGSCGNRSEDPEGIRSRRPSRSASFANTTGTNGDPEPDRDVTADSSFLRNS